MQGDESPIGPLKLQLPDLTPASSQERATVVLEGPDAPANPNQQQDHGSGKQHEGGQGGETQEACQGEPYGASFVSCAVREKTQHAARCSS